MSEHRMQADITKHVADTDSPFDYGNDGIKADVIAESTAAAGVTIDGVLLKDNAVTGNITGNVTGNVDGGGTLDSLVMDAALLNSAGNNIANASAIVGPIVFISAGNNVVGSQLPAAAAGKVIVVHNTSANGAKIYPAVSSAINALGANNAIEMAANTSAAFHGYNSTLWYTIPRVPS